MQVNPSGLASFYMDKWLLNADGHAIQTPTSSLFPVVRDNKTLMLKIIKEEGDEQNSCAALQHYSGQGAVKVFDYADDAFVMQRATGKTLTMFRSEQGDAEATRVICDVLQQLHGAERPAAEIHLPNLNILGLGFAAMRSIDQHVLPLPMLDFAEALFNKLVGSTSRECVLHGDLHHENLLFDECDGWLAIDPKGFVGDPIYDCAAFFKNPLADEGVSDKACVHSRANILQEQLGYPRERILQWAFVHCVLSVVWSLQDNSAIGPALPVAMTLFQDLPKD